MATTPLAYLDYGGAEAPRVAFAAAAVVGVNIAVNLAVGGGNVSPLYHWSWPATLIVGAAAFFVPSRPKRDLDKLPPRPDQRRRGTRDGD